MTKNLKNGIMKRLGQMALGWLLPPTCPGCDEIVSVFQKGLCKDCQEKLIMATEPLCKKCGKPLTSELEEYCHDCSQKEHFFTEGRSCFIYEERARQMIFRFKYQNRRIYAGFLADELYQMHQTNLHRWQPDLILAVPLHRKKQRSRGFNQAELLAQEVARRTGLTVGKQSLIRIYDTKPLKEMTKRERKQCLKDSFIYRGTRIQDKRILLIDDIYTTGSTVNEISKVLRKHGCSDIYVLTVAIGTERQGNRLRKCGQKAEIE